MRSTGWEGRGPDAWCVGLPPKVQWSGRRRRCYRCLRKKRSFSKLYCLYVEIRKFVVRGLVLQPKWQRLSNHWYVLVGSKSSSRGRGLLWYPNPVVSAADTSQTRVQNIDFSRLNFISLNLFPGPQKSFREVLRTPGSPNKDLLRSYEQVEGKSSESA